MQGSMTDHGVWGTAGLWSRVSGPAQGNCSHYVSAEEEAAGL
jgi:hypothetical protein